MFLLSLQSAIPLLAMHVSVYLECYIKCLFKCQPHVYIDERVHAWKEYELTFLIQVKCNWIHVTQFTGNRQNN